MIRNTRAVFSKNPYKFLKHVRGVIHVGANSGQERDIYNNYNIHVVWIEPIPEVFQKLVTNIHGYPNQLAYQYLVTGKDDLEHMFHVSNNDCASSSILELKLHKDIWPEVTHERTIILPGTTLASLVKRERININKYDALVLDTQGTELSVLKGAISILDSFKFIKTEVADFESYKGCCQLKDIDEFLKHNGFHEMRRNKFAERTEGGNYFDIVYKKNT